MGPSSAVVAHGLFLATGVHVAALAKVISFSAYRRRRCARASVAVIFPCSKERASQARQHALRRAGC